MATAYNPLINSGLPLNFNFMGQNINIPANVLAQNAALLPQAAPPQITKNTTPMPLATPPQITKNTTPMPLATPPQITKNTTPMPLATPPQATKIAPLTPVATPPPVTKNTTPLPRVLPPAPPAAQAPAIPDLSGLNLGNFNIGLLSPEAAQAQADYQAQNTYRLAKPTAGLLASQTDEFQLRDGVPGFQFVTNKGNAADITAKEVNEKRNLGGAANPSGFVPYVEGAKYRIWNEKGKDRILFEGEGEDALKKVYRYAQNLSATKGKKANWAVEMMDPATGQWSRVADDDPAKGFMGTLGKIVGTALPVATAFIPGLGTLGMIAAQTAAGAAGAGLAGRDPLKGAAMGGLTAAGGSLLGPAIQAGSSGAATTLGTAVGTGLGATAGGLATGQNLEGALATGLLAGGAAALGNELLGRGPQTQEGGDPIGEAIDASSGGALGGAASGTTGGGYNPVTNEIVVNPNVSPNVNVGPAVASGVYNAAENLIDVAGKKPPEEVPGDGPVVPAAYDAVADELTVSGKKPEITQDENGVLVVDYGDPFTTFNLDEAEIAKAMENATEDQKPFIEKLLEYLKYGLLGNALLGNVLGGGGGGGGGGATTPYTSVLGPTPTFGRGILQPYTGDYETYATRPEHMFFAPAAA